jgi:hypothetical protein
MASGDLLAVFTPQDNMPPSSGFATLDTRNGYLVLDFDDGSDESAIFKGYMPANYAGGGFDVVVGWMATSATSGTISLDGAWMSLSDDADDVDTKSFAAANNINPTTANATGEIDYATIQFDNGGDSDSVAADEFFLFKLTRDGDGTTSTDDVSGDMELWGISILEQ